MKKKNKKKIYMTRSRNTYYIGIDRCLNVSYKTMKYYGVALLDGTSRINILASLFSFKWKTWHRIQNVYRKINLIHIFLFVLSNNLALIHHFNNKCILSEFNWNPNQFIVAWFEYTINRISFYENYTNIHITHVIYNADKKKMF